MKVQFAIKLEINSSDASSYGDIGEDKRQVEQSIVKRGLGFPKPLRKAKIMSHNWVRTLILVIMTFFS